MIQYAEITHELAKHEWSRYLKCINNDRIGQLKFGKLLVWCREQEKKERLPKYKKDEKEPISSYLRRTCGLEKGRKIDPNNYKPGKVFRAVFDRTYPALLEADYDLLSVNAARNLSEALEPVMHFEKAGL